MQGISPQWFLHFPTLDYREAKKKYFACLREKNILAQWYY